MLNEPVQVIVAAYPDPRGARKALRRLRATQTPALVGIVDAAAVGSDGGGAVVVREAAMQGSRGFALSGIVGAVVALLAGPDGKASFGEAAADRAALLVESGFSGDTLAGAGGALAAEGSALVVAAETDWAGAVLRDAKRGAASLVSAELEGDVAARLGEAGGMVYVAGAAPRRRSGPGRIPSSRSRRGGSFSRPGSPHPNGTGSRAARRPAVKPGAPLLAGSAPAGGEARPTGPATVR